MLAGEEVRRVTQQNSGLPFSQRYGLAPVPTMPSVDEVSQDLQTDLLNAVLSACGGSELALQIWTEFLHRSITEAPRTIAGVKVVYRFPDVIDSAKLHFGNSPGWWVYDLIEVICHGLEDDQYMWEELHKQVNHALERAFAAVRMIDGRIAPITDEQQQETIEMAMRVPLAGVRTQLHNSLDLMSDRNDPKYGDSIKNSISAVETLCRKITGKNKATLSQALKQLKDAGIQLHPSLERAFEQLYGYTSDESGVRHALTDEGHLELEDAKYMLVTCSAFINYLVVKADKVKVDLTTGGAGDDCA